MDLEATRLERVRNQAQVCVALLATPARALMVALIRALMAAVALVSYNIITEALLALVLPPMREEARASVPELLLLAAAFTAAVAHVSYGIISEEPLGWLVRAPLNWVQDLQDWADGLPELYEPLDLLLIPLDDDKLQELVLLRTRAQPNELVRASLDEPPQRVLNLLLLRLHDEAQDRLERALLDKLLELQLPQPREQPNELVRAPLDVALRRLVRAPLTRLVLLPVLQLAPLDRLVLLPALRLVSMDRLVLLQLNEWLDPCSRASIYLERSADEAWLPRLLLASDPVGTIYGDAGVVAAASSLPLALSVAEAQGVAAKRTKDKAATKAARAARRKSKQAEHEKREKASRWRRDSNEAERIRRRKEKQAEAKTARAARRKPKQDEHEKRKEARRWCRDYSRAERTRRRKEKKAAKYAPRGEKPGSRRSQGAPRRVGPKRKKKQAPEPRAEKEAATPPQAATAANVATAKEPRAAEEFNGDSTAPAWFEFYEAPTDSIPQSAAFSGDAAGQGPGLSSASPSKAPRRERTTLQPPSPAKLRLCALDAACATLFQVFAQMPDGATATMTCPDAAETTIEQVHVWASARAGRSPRVGWLTYGGKPLGHMSNTLRDYNIQPESTIVFSVRRLGGARRGAKKKVGLSCHPTILTFPGHSYAPAADRWTSTRRRHGSSASRS